MTRTLRFAAPPLLAALALAGAGCVDNTQSVYITGFLKIEQSAGCKVSADQADYTLSGLVDSALLGKFSQVGYVAAPRLKNNMLATASTTQVERNVIFPQAVEVGLKATAGKQLPASLAPLAGKFSISFPFPAIEPGGADTAVVELVQRNTLIEAAKGLSDPLWDGILVATTRVAYLHHGETQFTAALDFPIRVAPGSLSTPDRVCPTGGFQSSQIQKACFIGQDEPVTCCTQGNISICNDQVPISSGTGGDGGI